jgi:glycosyltransferase involved in cell wall biosynthesis
VSIHELDSMTSLNHSDALIMDQIVQHNQIDADALAAVYHRCVQENRLAEVRHLLGGLQVRFPNDRQVKQLYIALCLQQNHPDEAMRAIQSLVACCTPDNGLIDAALAVRPSAADGGISSDNADGPSISLCMVVKNEAARIGACLNSVQSLVDEIVVVDTGSTDRTKDVARIFGARIFEYQWNNDFASARNYGLDQVIGDWVLILDADEIIAAQDHDYLRKLVEQAGPKQMAFNIETRNYTHVVNAIGWQANNKSYRQYEAGSGWYPTRKVRLFPRTPSIRFRFPVHERVDPKILELGMPIVECPIPVHHYGCLNEAKKLEKAQLYLQLGYAKLDQFKDDLEALRELAVQAGQLEQWDKAIELWQHFIRLKPDYPEAHVNLAGLHWQIGQYDKALACAKSAVALDQNLKEAHYNVAM